MASVTPRKVKKPVGMNPIARAVAHENLRKSVIDQKIELYLLNEGAECKNILIPIFMLMTAFLISASRDKTVGSDIREIRILKGAVSACEQMITNNSYRHTNTITLDVALDCAIDLSKRVDPVLFNTAWNEVSGGV